MDVQVAVPLGYYRCMATCLGLAIKFQIHVGTGIINANYRRNLVIVLFNLANTNYHMGGGGGLSH